MSDFEQVGVDRQIEATTIAEAIRFFKWSCDACCRKGFQIRCDRCCIDQVHKETLEFLSNTSVANA